MTLEFLVSKTRSGAPQAYIPRKVLNLLCASPGDILVLDVPIDGSTAKISVMRKKTERDVEKFISFGG